MSESAKNKKEILVVDDEKNILSSLEGILSDEGFSVLKAGDGETALDLVKTKSPDLVMLDIWLPGMDGIQVLKAIKAIGPDTKVIMMSGHGSIEAAVMTTKIGAFDFIEKPLSMENVISVVKAAFSSEPEKGKGKSKKKIIDAPFILHGKKGAPNLVTTDRPQRTLKKSMVLCGSGLHSGVKTGLILTPLPANSGIIFGDISSGETVPAHACYVDSTAYATTIKRGSVAVRTVEHIMAALNMYQITNLLIKVGDEIPIMDGSAVDFCQLIEEAEIREQKEFIEEIVIDKPISVKGTRKGEAISVEPLDHFRVSYHLDYPDPVGIQDYCFDYKDAAQFKKEIAPARTFGFIKDLEGLEEKGLGGGGKLNNIILVDHEKVINTELRFKDEFVRHKILDILGDFYLLGRPIRGHIKASMTGHSENFMLVNKILKELLGG